MRTLYLLRHAKSSWDDPSLPDHERPLAPRGQRDAKRLAAHLPRLGCLPELILCSTAARTQETLELARLASAASTVLIEDGLYAATTDELLARLRDVPETVGSVMVIGHNPGLQQLASTLASEGNGLAELQAKFPTAALATLEVERSWDQLAPGDATLAGYVVPKQLR